MSASIHNPHFLLRRLHSLFGLVPLGLFLCFHLWENSQSRFGAAHYNGEVVAFLQSLNYLPIIEMVFIVLPLLFHAGYGVMIAYGAHPEPNRYPWLHNRLYLLQRVSGLAILLFLIIHVGWTRVLGIWQPEIKADLFHHMQALLSNPATFVIYGLGMMLSVFHLCYGLWNMAIVWGLTISQAAQKRFFIAMMGLMLVLMAMGWHGILGFVMTDAVAWNSLGEPQISQINADILEGCCRRLVHQPEGSGGQYNDLYWRETAAQICVNLRFNKVS